MPGALFARPTPDASLLNRSVFKAPVDNRAECHSNANQLNPAFTSSGIPHTTHPSAGNFAIKQISDAPQSRSPDHSRIPTNLPQSHAMEIEHVTKSLI